MRKWLQLVAIAAPLILASHLALAQNIPLVDSSGNPPPATIAGNGSWSSACLSIGQIRAFTSFFTMSGAATLKVQRYLDIPKEIAPTAPGCTMPVGTGTLVDPSNPLALATGAGCNVIQSGSYCGNVGADDGLIYGAVILTVTDTSASTNTIVTNGYRLKAGPPG